MKNNAEKLKTVTLTAKELKKIHAEEAAAGVDEEFRTPKRWRMVPRDQRLKMPPEAFEPRNIHVSVKVALDLDVLDALKALAAEQKTDYKSLINAELRRIVGTAATHTVTAKSKRALAVSNNAAMAGLRGSRQR